MGAVVPRNRWVSQAAPTLTLLGAILLDLLWIPIPGFNAVIPAFPVMAVFCWSIWRPQLMPYVAVFLAGLVEDLVRGTPLGAASLSLLAVQGFVWAQQRMLRYRSFDVLWFGFAMAALLAAVATWIAISLANRMVLSPWPGLMQYGLTVAVFPAVAYMLQRLERTLARPG